MAKRTSERVQVMKEGFLEKREAGWTIVKIAEFFQLSTGSVYNSLQEIADANGVTRDSLLYVVHKPHGPISGSSRILERVDPEALKGDFETLKETTKTIIDKIDLVLQEE